MMISIKQGLLFTTFRPNYIVISEKTSAANSNNKDNVLEFAINLGGTKGILSPLPRYWGGDMSPPSPLKIGPCGRCTSSRGSDRLLGLVQKANSKTSSSAKRLLHALTSVTYCFHLLFLLNFKPASLNLCSIVICFLFDHSRRVILFLIKGTKLKNSIKPWLPRKLW